MYFALTVPFSYYDQVVYLEGLDERLRGHERVYYWREVLTRSSLGLDLFVLTLTGRE